MKLEPNVTHTINLPFDIAPGLLCVEIKAVGTGSEAEEMLKETLMVQNTNLGITTKVFKNTLFAWVTRLHDASPVAGAKVSLYDDSAHKMIEGITDASGTVSLAAKNIASRAGLLKTAFLVAEGEGYVAVSHLDDRHLSQPRQFGLKGSIEDFEPLYAAVFSDRGIYRPGEVVHLKMIVGNVAGLQSPEVKLQVQDSQGQQVLNKTLLLDHFGSTDIDLTLKEQAAVGEYIVQVTYGKQVAIRQFQVEEYRVPTFKVSVNSEPESGQQGTNIDTLIRADYLHGGSLDGREVRWEVLRQQLLHRPLFQSMFLISAM